ncbi:MAG: tail fiber domain-containing protein [Nitrospirae bacterium]|nr:tail fiber domain-containing protein [Nitrospirota bacterium]
MKKIIIIVITGLLLVGGTLYAANGDLIVNGKVGIGTTNPGNKLDISGGSGTGAKISIGQTTQSEGSTIQNAGTYNIGRSYFSSSWDDNFSISTFDDSPNPNWTIGIGNGDGGWSGNKYIFMNAVGNIGIGTNNPIGKLDVNGQIAIEQKNFGGNAGLLIKGNSPTNNWPNMGFSLVNSASADIIAAIIGGQIVSNTQGSEAMDLIFYTANNGSPLERMRIQSGGGVNVLGTVYSNGTALTSDSKFKMNLQRINDPIDKVINLRGISYEWKRAEFKEKNLPEGRHYGVIAQEIEKVLPEVVSTGPDGTKAVAYSEIIPVLIEAIKEHQKAIENQQKRIEQLEKNR